MNIIVSQVADRIHNHEALLGYSQQYKWDLQVLLGGLDRGLSTSVVVLGLPGSGKSKLVTSALNQYKSKHLEVYLNGYIHTDDRLAVADLARQLHKEVDLDDPKLSYSDCFAHLMSTLNDETGDTLPLVLILDNMHLFAHQHNQTLLYNLLDSSHDGPIPLLIIALSSRLDVADLLEKRVRSRLSQQVLLTFNDFGWEEYMNYAKDLITLPKSKDKHVKEWNMSVATSLNDKKVENIFQNLYWEDRSIAHLKHFLALILAQIYDGSYLSVQFVQEAYSLISSDYRDNDDSWSVLKGISLLEMCLLIAIRHLLDDNNYDAFNFEMVYQEFIKFAQMKLQMVVAPRTTILKAFEKLSLNEIIVAAEDMKTRSRPPSTTFRLYKLQLHTKTVREALNGFNPCPFQVKQWAEHRIR